MLSVNYIFFFGICMHTTLSGLKFKKEHFWHGQCIWDTILNVMVNVIENSIIGMVSVFESIIIVMFDVVESSINGMVWLMYLKKSIISMINFVDCTGKVCLNGGTMDPSTCSCSCKTPATTYVGATCQCKTTWHSN